MKKSLILVCVLLSNQLRAQTITYDHHLGQYTSADHICITQGVTVRYQLININTMAQKIEINGNLVSLTTSTPTEIATLFRIKTDNADQSLANTQDAVIEMSKAANNAANNVTKVKPAAKTALQIEAIETAKLVVDCKDYYRKAGKIKDVLAVQKTLDETLIDDHYYDVSSMLTALSNRRIDASLITNLNTDFQAFEVAYDTVDSQYSAAEKAALAAGDKETAARIESARKQVRNEYQALEKEYDDALAGIDRSFSRAKNPVSYVFTSSDLFVTDDTDEVEYRIQTGDNTFQKNLYVHKGLKVDYSVGPVFKFIKDDLYTLDSDNTLRKRTNNNLLTPGIASMMHVYPRYCQRVGIGGVFGINADFKEITDINLGFLAGASVLFGRSPRVILSTGVSVSTVDRLKDGQFSVGSVYKDTKIEEVTQRVLCPSFFFSVSLGITKRTVLKP